MKTHLTADEQSIRRRAAVLSVLMHGFLLAGMVVMVDWKSVHVTPAVMQATLWDSLPDNSVAETKPQRLEPVAQPQEVEPKPEVSKPVEPQAIDKTEPTPEIVLKQQKQEKLRKQAEEKQAQEQLKAQQRQEKLKALQAAISQQEHEDALKKVQQALRQQDLEGQPAAAPNTSVLANYLGLMAKKIRSNVNPSLCSANNLELLIELRLTPSGDIAGLPKLIKGSDDSVCDEAVLRAVLAAKPFELPANDVAVRNKMMELIRLKFKPHA